MTMMLIDGTNLLVRAAHVGQRTHLSSADGTPTATLLIFVNMLSRHVREEKPDQVVVCWDGGKSEWRKAIYAGYKEARHERPEEEPHRPFAQVKEFLTLAGVHHIEREGFEADDLIANYWNQVMPVTTEIVIVSGDKDFLQLVGRWTQQVRPTTAQVADRWTKDRVVEEFGVDTPAQLSLVMALTGDKSDGVPGIKGFGTKTAVKMLKANEWNLSKVLAERPADLHQAYVNLRLVDLREHAPYVALHMPPPFRPTRLGDLACQALLEYLDRYQLSSVRERVISDTLWKG